MVSFFFLFHYSFDNECKNMFGVSLYLYACVCRCVCRLFVELHSLGWIQCFIGLVRCSLVYVSMHVIPKFGFHWTCPILRWNLICQWLTRTLINSEASLSLLIFGSFALKTQTICNINDAEREWEYLRMISEPPPVCLAEA